ncbi:MAG: hypothetical protein GY755_23525, partial [Chloroflexi bacterium]|nr:hypothetical protein [Chloroflexota bacterium]
MIAKIIGKNQYNINDNKTYKIDIIFDTMQLQKHLKLEKHIIIKTDFKFNIFTKTQTIIDCVLNKIENREEYLNYFYNYKIINLNYICECIRNNNNIIKTGISFVLIYCSELYRLQIS